MNRLLIVLLVLLVGIGPVGGVIAGPHTCAPDVDQSMSGGAMMRGDHAHHQSLDQPDNVSQSISGCDNCDRGCCQGSQCSMGHCAGTAAAFQTSTALEFERYAISAIVLNFDRPIAGRITPPFRPPQV